MTDMNINFIEAQVTNLSLNPGEVLGVKITSDDIPDSSLGSLRKKLEALFPNNKVILFLMPVNSNIEFTAIQPSADCGPQTCVNCNCGKKESV